MCTKFKYANFELACKRFNCFVETFFALGAFK